MATTIYWVPSTDVNIYSYTLLTGTSTSGTFNTMSVVLHDLSGSNYDQTNNRFFYTDISGTSLTWYQMKSTDILSQSSPLTFPFQVDATYRDLCTLPELKQFLNIQVNTDDLLLERLISAASEFFIQEVGVYDFGYRLITETKDGDGKQAMILSYDLPQQVSSVYVDGVLIPPATGSNPNSTGWLYDGARVRLRGDYFFTQGIQNVEINYFAGYLDIPADVTQCVIELAALRYRERTRLGVMNTSVGGENVSYQTTSLPYTIQRVINNYNRLHNV
jgi:hypothetical protein